MIEPSYFAVIPASVRYHSALTPNAKLLYGELTALANRDGFCWASNGYFANLYSVGINTVSEWIASLGRIGAVHIEVDRAGGNKRKIYIREALTFPRGSSHEKSGEPYHEKSVDNKTRKKKKVNIPAGKRIEVDLFAEGISAGEPVEPEPDRKAQAVQIYNAYPRKVARPNALKAIEKALKKTPFEIILAAVLTFAKAREGEDSQFTPHPATWFNRQSYLDEPGELARRNTIPVDRKCRPVPLPSAADFRQGRDRKK